MLVARMLVARIFMARILVVRIFMAHILLARILAHINALFRLFSLLLISFPKLVLRIFPDRFW